MCLNHCKFFHFQTRMGSQSLSYFFVCEAMHYHCVRQFIHSVLWANQPPPPNVYVEALNPSISESETKPTTTLHMDFQHPELSENKFLLVKSTLSVLFCDDSPRKFIHVMRERMGMDSKSKVKSIFLNKVLPCPPQMWYSTSL